MPSIESISSSGLVDQFRHLSLEEKCIQRPFNLLDEYLRLGITLPSENDEHIHQQACVNHSEEECPRTTPDSSVEHPGPGLSTAASIPMNPPRYPYCFQSKWRISMANQLYQLCPSYPRMLVVPSAISDAHLSLSSKQRSTHRIPALTWIHPNNGAALCR